MQRSQSSHAAGRAVGLLPGSLAGRLALLLAVFMVLATVAVVLREYGAGEERLVAETDATLSVEATVAADRLESALSERLHLVDLWSALETSQDLAVDDVDKRVSQSLVDLADALGSGTQAVAVRGEVILAASEPGRLGVETPPLPAAVERAVAVAAPGVRLVTGEEGYVVASSDVRSAVDGGVLGRIVVWTPLHPFLTTAIPLELASARLTTEDGTLLARGEGLDGPDAAYIWASHTGRTVAGPVVVSVGRARAEVTGALHQAGRQLATLALLFLVLALPSALLVIRSATSSLARLTRAARDLDPRHPEPIPAASPWAPSEVRVLADAISTMVARLEEARTELARAESLAAVGMLTKSLAHEIRTPLSVLRAGTEILARAPGAGSREREVSEMLEAEVERLARLVDDLLVFGRQSTPVLQDADLRDVAGSAIAALEADAAEKGVELRLDGETAPLRADPDLLRQVVVNLVTNATRACAGGGRVVVRTSTHGNVAMLEVEDDGEGIPADMLDDIWKPLVTTHRSGNGLGLPIVRQLVEAHGGRIGVESTPGEGTRMRVTLPTAGREQG